MLERLGIEGMSSDESDRENGVMQYRILTPRWRAPEVRIWLWVFDTMHLFDRHHRGTPSGLRGAWPRRRLLGNRTGNSNTFVPGLPINAYSATWLDSRAEVRNTVHPSPTPYLFQHHTHIMQCVVITDLVSYSDSTSDSLSAQISIAS
jgi:hypothetical protein